MAVLAFLSFLPAPAAGEVPEQGYSGDSLFENYSLDSGSISPRSPLGVKARPVSGADGQASATAEPSIPTTGATAPEPPSAFESYVSSMLPDKEGLELFGYDLFDIPPGSFVPSETIPVGSDYVLVPGDELRVTLWGQVNGDHTVVVDREGKIVLPEIGAVFLAGLRFAEARSLLEKELGRYYKPGEVKMNVGMARLSTITVFVVGKTRNPGSYSVSSLSTVLNALLAAGGPSRSGTMRDIQVKRSGKVITHFDLYDLLLEGDKTSDVRLESGDVIFIPPAGSRVAISGNVNTPAIYEVKDEGTAEEMISLAGGLDDIAYKGRLSIFRVVNGNRTTVFEKNLAEADLKDVEIRSGDIIRVFPVVRDEEVIRVSGAVHRPGEYGAADQLTVKELIELAGGLKYYAYTVEAELTRVDVTQEGPVTEKRLINLSRAIEGAPEHNIELKNNDYLFIRPVPEWEIYNTVELRGEVRFPGTYTVKKGERISSLIDRAGGFTGKAYLKGAVFTREAVREINQRQLGESIRRLEQEMLTRSARSIEAALNPEEVRLREAAAEQRAALIAKMKAATATGRIAIDLAPLEEFRGSNSDLPLEDGDMINIPETPSEVHVIGAVYNQTAFVHDRGLNISDYISLAGGLTRNADKDEMYILKINGTAVSRQNAGSFMSIRWDEGNNRWVGKSFSSVSLDPGDTIVVPERVEKVAWLREFKDITQILYQIAVTAGVLIVAF